MNELIKYIDSFGHDKDFELVENTEDTSEIAILFAALSNSKGGSVFFGVKPSKKIKGVYPQEVFTVIQNVNNNFLSSPIVYYTEEWIDRHYFVVEVKIPISKHKIKVKNYSEKMSLYIRYNNASFLANKIIEKVWKYESFGVDSNLEEKKDQIEIVLSSIKAGADTLSRLYKSSGINYSEVDNIVSFLIYKKEVELKLTQKGNLFSIV